MALVPDLKWSVVLPAQLILDALDKAILIQQLKHQHAAWKSCWPTAGRAQVRSLGCCCSTIMAPHAACALMDAQHARGMRTLCLLEPLVMQRMADVPAGLHPPTVQLARSTAAGVFSTTAGILAARLRQPQPAVAVTAAPAAQQSAVVRPAPVAGSTLK